MSCSRNGRRRHKSNAGPFRFAISSWETDLAALPPRLCRLLNDYCLSAAASSDRTQCYDNFAVPRVCPDHASARTTWWTGVRARGSGYVLSLCRATSTQDARRPPPCSVWKTPFSRDGTGGETPDRHSDLDRHSLASAAVRLNRQPAMRLLIKSLRPAAPSVGLSQRHEDLAVAHYDSISFLDLDRNPLASAAD